MAVETHGTRSLDAYEEIVGAEGLDEIRRLGRYLEGARLVHVNSTSKGGGVAEILHNLVPLMREVGLDVSWEVVRGDPEFYKVTKRFHNALHGRTTPIEPEMLDRFRETTERNLDLVDPDADFVCIHDPQPVGLVTEKGKGHARWVWRCHIDLSEADWQVWGFLRPWVEQYDVAMFHLPQYARRLSIPQVLLPPAIDPLSDKNRELEPEVVRETLETHGIDPERPIVLQVSRFDWLKDPVGVVEAYRLAKKWVDCQLVLAGGSADDDPEGEEVLAAVEEAAGDDPDIHVLALPPDAHLTINALQRGATVVVQKSVREGFGLVVTEAMWKGRPIVGGAVGGIRSQLIHGENGFLVHTVEGCAFRLRQLLSDPVLAEALGRTARQTVQDQFLITTLLKNYLTLLLSASRRPSSGVFHLGRPSGWSAGDTFSLASPRTL